MKIRTVVLLVLATLAIAACGNKGPLVLPDENETETTFEDEAVEEGAVEDDNAEGGTGDQAEGDADPPSDEPQDDGRR